MRLDKRSREFYFRSRHASIESPIRAHPAKPFRTIADAARSHQLLTLRCNLCRRRMSYLASDLVQVIDPTWPIHVPPFGCGKCGKDYVTV